MRHNQDAAVTAATVADEARSALLADLLGQVAGCFPRRETRQCCGQMVSGLLMELDDHNCQPVAEAIGHRGPHRLQHLLARRHRYTGQLSFYRCWTPGPVPLSKLIAIAVARWRIEEDHQLAKQSTGLDAGQVIRWKSWHRWTARTPWGIRAAFVAGDEVYGGRELRRGIRQREMGYVLAVRANHTVTTGSHPRRDRGRSGRPDSRPRLAPDAHRVRDQGHPAL